jgi:hypothetical protein
MGLAIASGYGLTSGRHLAASCGDDSSPFAIKRRTVDSEQSSRRATPGIRNSRLRSKLSIA